MLMNILYEPDRVDCVKFGNNLTLVFDASGFATFGGFTVVAFDTDLELGRKEDGVWLNAQDTSFILFNGDVIDMQFSSANLKAQIAGVESDETHMAMNTSVYCKYEGTVALDADISLRYRDIRTETFRTRRELQSIAAPAGFGSVKIVDWSDYNTDGKTLLNAEYFSDVPDSLVVTVAIAANIVLPSGFIFGSADVFVSFDFSQSPPTIALEMVPFKVSLFNNVWFDVDDFRLLGGSNDNSTTLYLDITAIENGNNYLNDSVFATWADPTYVEAWHLHTWEVEGRRPELGPGYF